MASKAKFHAKRQVIKGETTVETGFKAGELRFRLNPPNDRPYSLTYEQAVDLADVLDEALTQQEEDPLE